MKKIDRNSKLLSGTIAVFSIGLTFIGWGYVNSGGKAHAAPSSGAGVISHFMGRPGSPHLAEAETKPAPKDDTDILLNDPFMQNKWGLEKTSARKAWEVSQGSKEIIVAVIDTGIDQNHRDLAGSLWVNPGESGVADSDSCHKASKPLLVAGCDKSNNGIDDDSNGFVDDVHGWDFVYNDNHMTDNHGHGTHIAGIIAANGQGADGQAGVRGVAPNVSLMILKYYDPKAPGSNNLKNTIQSIRYAIKMHANIINYSGGGTDYSAEEFAAVKDAEKAGILFVAAAGNERSNSDEVGKHYYPADYDLQNLISVTAVNREETKVLSSSNYGVRTVDLAAPGENIFSTLPNNSYGVMTGTSQATAFVTGVAALVESVNRDFTFLDVKKYILRTGDEYATLLSKTGTAKLLNSYRALTSLDKGVSASGVVATNTANVNENAFAADGDIKDSMQNTSAMNMSGDDSDEPAKNIAMFGRDFVKAIGHPAKAKEVDVAAEPAGEAKPH